MAGNTKPQTHPNSVGLDNAIRDGVQAELDRRGVGGGGGGGDRLAILEREVAIIKETMVKQKDFDASNSKINQDSADIKLELARLPLKLIGWMVPIVAAIVTIVFTIYRMVSHAPAT